MTGLVNNIQRYSVNDGGGIRTVIFLQGCPLRCRWCSNPETQSATNGRIYWKNKCIGCGKCVEVCPHRIGCTNLNDSRCTLCLRCVDHCYAQALQTVAREETAEELVEQVAKDMAFYQTSGGGVTISGGEALLQWEFAAEILSQARAMCIDTALETTGFAPYEHLLAVAHHCDRVLYDVKHMGSTIHREYTGVPNELILGNLARLSREGIKIIIRVPLIHHVNDDEQNIGKLADFARDHNIGEIHLLPFHRLGETKYVALSRPIDMPDATVPEAHIEALKTNLEHRGFSVCVGG